MSWKPWEIGATIATCGLYGAGKLAYEGYKKVTGIADDVEDASEQAGLALAKIGDTVVTLGDNLNDLVVDDISPLIEDIDDLFVIERLTPRENSDLWDEEKERLSDLIQKKNESKARIDTLREEIKAETEVEIPDIYGLALQTWIIKNANPDWLIWERMIESWGDLIGGIGADESRPIWGRLGEGGKKSVFKIRSINYEIIKIDKEIHEILYNEPGVLSTTIYNSKEVLERFNTIEQPKIEDTLDSVDENLVESKEILEQVKKLFVIKKRMAIAESEFTGVKLEELNSLKDEYNLLEAAITKDLNVAKQLMDLKDEIQPGSLNLAVSDSHLFELNPNLKKDLEIGNISGEMRDAFKNKNYRLSPNAKISDTDYINWKISDDEKEYVIRESDNQLKVYAKSMKLTKPGVLSPKSLTNPNNKAKESILNYKAESNVYKAAKQPPGLKMAAGFSSKYSAYNSKYALQKASIKLQEKDLSKLKLRIDNIRYNVIEEPGVIPRILAKFEDTLEQFNTEEQPRIETILDSVNDNLTESQKAINNVNTTFEKILGFVDNHNLLLRIFSGIVGVGIVITLILIPILIIRMILFGI